MINSLDIDKSPQDTRVVVAMSGGVDSSVVAAMLKREGYDVIGITLQLYDHGVATGAATHRKGACCAGQDIHDARRVAEFIDIPHYVLDYENKFRNEVIDKFVSSYVNGETPVPCIDCNSTVKFRDLLQTARELDADVLATGHYILSKPLPVAQSSEPGQKAGSRAIYRSFDQDRDQSYFLFTVTQEQIDYLRFPLGGMTKADVRNLAHQLGLKVADKSDSQDICFVPSGNYADVIKSLYPDAEKPGDIVHVDGRQLGRHEGIINYTIGQRRGLGIASGERLFVVSIEPANNRIIIGSRSELTTRIINIRDINWLGDAPLSAINDSGLDIFARVRSTRPPVPAIIRRHDNDDDFSVTLEVPEGGIAPGQACVFYDSDAPQARILGGGWISGNVSGKKPFKSAINAAGSAAVASQA